jgi:hypothetical protein
VGGVLVVVGRAASVVAAVVVGLVRLHLEKRIQNQTSSCRQ